MIADLLLKISVVGDVASSKFIHYFGLFAGILPAPFLLMANAAVTNAEIKKAVSAAEVVTKAADPALPEFVIQLLPYASFISLVAAVVLISKNVLDMLINVLKLYYERKDKADANRNKIKDD